MRIYDTAIPDVKIIEPMVFEDARGLFFESFNSQKFNAAIGRDVRFIQDNHSKSLRNVLRGLHYQIDPQAQGKLVRCIKGEVFDVAVDLRKNSKTFGKWVGLILSEENKKQLWIPEGFAHGFLTLSETAEFAYKTTNYYSQKHERSIRWNDDKIGILWPLSSEPLISDKDSKANNLIDSELFEQ